MSYFGSTDWLIEVQKGNIPGHSTESVLGRIAMTAGSGAFEDLWTIGGFRTAITAAESLVIVSNNAADASAGTGARTVTVVGLDAAYAVQIETVTMTGTVDVAIPGTWIRPRVIQAATVGSTGSNVGIIELRKSGGAIGVDVRNVMPAAFGLSHDAPYTVPAGKTGLLIQASFFYPKNADGTMKNLIKIEGANQPIIEGLQIPFYQASWALNTKSPFQIAEKTDVFFQVQTTAAATNVTALFDWLLIDNNLMNLA